MQDVRIAESPQRINRQIAPHGAVKTSIMNTTRNAYIRRIRAESSYPTFRSAVRLISLFLYILGGLSMFGGIILAFFISPQGSAGIGIAAFFTGLVSGLISIAFGTIVKETAYILADIADSIVDANAK